jgi:hypothetical protein
VGAWAYHWLWRDFGALVWPNIAAVPFCAILSTIGADWRMRKHLRRHHDALYRALLAPDATAPPPNQN